MTTAPSSASDFGLLIQIEDTKIEGNQQDACGHFRCARECAYCACATEETAHPRHISVWRVQGVRVFPGFGIQLSPLLPAITLFQWLQLNSSCLCAPCTDATSRGFALPSALPLQEHVQQAQDETLWETGICQPLTCLKKRNRSIPCSRGSY